MPFILLFLLLISMPAGAMPVGPFAQASSGRARTPPCVSGACSFTWAGPAGQPVATYNNAWVDMTSSLPVANAQLNGSGLIQSTGAFANYGLLLSTSTSDTAQVVFAAQATTADLNRQVCVRAVPGGTSGYCLQPCYSNGDGTWARICINRDGTNLVQSALGSWSRLTDHTMRVVVTGTTTLTVDAYVDGTLAVSATDATPLGTGHMAMFSGLNGNIDDAKFGAAQDF